MPETTPLIKAALNLRGGAGFDVYFLFVIFSYKIDVIFNTIIIAFGDKLIFPSVIL